MTTDPLCEACLLAPVEVLVGEDDPGQPYRVCQGCAGRLNAYALRPLEWFNLASIHGPAQHLMHDDFYWDNGIAQQPQERVRDAKLYPAPRLKHIEHDLERLLDYAMTLDGLDRRTIKALLQHPKPLMLESLRRRVEEFENIDIETTAYDICRKVSGTVAEEWIEACWEHWRPETFYALASATAACMPFERGFQTVIGILEDDHSRGHLSNHSALGWSLAPFRSRMTLEWMENHIYLITGDTWILSAHEHWGRVAARSHFSWPVASRWLDLGRPLSFMAVVAIMTCLEDNTMPKQGPPPTLEEPASVTTMLQRLDAYIAADPAPRIRNYVQTIREKMTQDRV